MTKEEMLYNELGDFPRSMLSDKDIYKAMDEYAKQESIAFKRWCDENQAVQEYGRGKTLTDEELYEIFCTPSVLTQQSKNKQL